MNKLSQRLKYECRTRFKPHINHILFGIFFSFSITNWKKKRKRKRKKQYTQWEKGVYKNLGVVFKCWLTPKGWSENMVFIILHEEAYILRVLFQFTTRSVLNPNQTDNIYAMKHGSGGSKKELLAALYSDHYRKQLDL